MPRLLQGSPEVRRRRRPLFTAHFQAPPPGSILAQRPLDGQPHRGLSIRIVEVTREQVPVQVRHLIAQQLVIELVRSIIRLNSLRQQAHLVEISPAFIRPQFVQFRGMAARDQEAVTLIELPHAQQGDAMRKMPDNIGGAELLDRLDLPAKGTIRLVQGKLLPGRLHHRHGETGASSACFSCGCCPASVPSMLCSSLLGVSSSSGSHKDSGVPPGHG